MITLVSGFTASNCYCLCRAVSVQRVHASRERREKAEDTLSLCPALAHPNFGLASTPPPIPILG